MKKKKIAFAKYVDMHDEKELTGKDGTKIMVRNHIPYVDKIQMCRDIIDNSVMIHDESCVFENIDIHARRLKTIVNYYTNIAIDDETEAYLVADFLINNELIGPLMEYIHDDYMEAEDIYVTMINMVVDTYEDDMSLKKAIKKSFGFLWTGEDIAESYAKAEATKSVLFDAFNALQKEQREKEENVNNGQLSVGGNIINFAKRTE